MIGTPFLYYAETKPHIFIFASLGSIFSRTVWNTIDDRYSSFVFYIETKPHFLILPLFKAYSLWQCGILSMIDTPIFVLCRNEVTYLYFWHLRKHFQ